MDFRDRARLDTSRVRDVRGGARGGGWGGGGRRSGWGGGRGGGRGAAVGGGGIGLVVLVVALLLGVSPDDVTGAGSDPGGIGPGAGVTSDGTELSERCQTGADADRDETCRIVAVVNSLEDYWSQTLQGFRPPTTEIFGQATSTGCGNATSAVGPFYCPADEGIYLDPGFFDELQRTYGARGGDFAQAYVLAHEYGHHIQTLTGASEQARRGDQEGPQSGSVRLELQADCYAGVWAAHAAAAGFVTFDETDVVEGLSAAAAVGDDRIQERSAGRVDPESWTHGSAEQRQEWFLTGVQTGDPNACDTFGVPTV